MSEQDDIKTYEEFKKRFQYDPRKSLIGQGGNCDVFKAYDNRWHRNVAVKVSQVDITDESRSLKEETERVLKLPKHDNIANYEECFRFSVGEFEFDYAILEYYKNGNLFKFSKRTPSLAIEQKLSILKEILDGIHFLHKNNIIHRDLKPENVLIFYDGNKEKYIPKITDFEASKDVETDKSSIKIATPFYSSPEQLTEGCNTDYNTDLWSFGIIALVFLDVLLPSDKETLKQIKQGQLPPVDFLPEAWQTLIKECLKEKPEERIKSCEDCLKIIAGYKQDDYEEVKTDKIVQKKNGEEKEDKIPPIKRKRNWQTRVMNIAVYVFAVLLFGTVYFLFYEIISQTFTAMIQIEDWKGRNSTQLIYESKSTISILGKEPKTFFDRKIEFPDISAKYNGKKVKVDFMQGQYYPFLELVNYSIILKKGEISTLQIKIKGLEEIHGKVTNKKTGTPIDSAKVTVQIISVYTDKEGKYRIAIPPEIQEIEQTVSVIKKGFKNYFETINLAGNTDSIDFKLKNSSFPPSFWVRE